MDYAASLKYLDSFYNFEKVSADTKNRSWNLKRMTHLLRLFERPQDSFLPLIIAGTKGKGSTGYFIESILYEAGIPTGFYSSPHLQTPRERIRLSGKEVSPRLWALQLTRIRDRLSANPPPPDLGRVTYFEIMTLLALMCFRHHKARVALLEVGLGGRLDATNAVDSPLAVITPVSFDHEAFLGKTLKAIGREKAGVIKRGAFVVTTPQPGEVMPEIISRCRTRKARLYRTGKGRSLHVSMAGAFQRLNASAAVKAVEILRAKYGLPVERSHIAQGLRRRSWPGRLETMGRDPEWVLDVAHNPSAAGALAKSLKTFKKKKRAILLFGTLKDKDAREMLKKLKGICGDIVLTRADSPRAFEVPVLMGYGQEFYDRVYPVGSLSDAVRLAAQLAGKGGRVIVTGSFYLVGEVRSILCGKKR